MAQVSTPRFYISILQWLKSLGKLTVGESNYITDKHELSLVDINPTTQATLNGYGSGESIGLTYESHAGNYDTLMPNSQNFIMILGHDFSDPIKFYFRNAWDGDYSQVANSHEVVNYTAGSGAVQYGGFSIGRGSDAHDITGNLLQLIFEDYDIGVDYKFGSLLYGSYHDMSHAADLNLTLTRDFSGVKTIETKGGASLSNSFYTKPPKWGENMEAWQLGDQDFSVEGRRIWDLSFSFLSDSSVFPDNPTEITDGGGWEVDTTTPDFMSEVLKKTRGSMLPFIFQPNTDENIFAICKFDQNSFSFQQTAPNLYSVKMKIREVW